ncbi:Dabb family protein [Aureispira anguillae]|nr:Dabb family protein [Aureispira anguillae]
MLRHIVLFKIFDPEHNIPKAMAFFYTLPEIEEVQHFSLQQDQDSILLYTEFESKAALKIYLEHDIHTEVKRNTERLIEEKKIFDF